jgi:hypothetical protein
MLAKGKNFLRPPRRRRPTWLPLASMSDIVAQDNRGAVCAMCLKEK